MSAYCIFCVNFVFYVFLQYFDTVGWVFWPVKTVTRITCTVLVETLNPALSISQPIIVTSPVFDWSTRVTDGWTNGRAIAYWAICVINDCHAQKWPLLCQTLTVLGRNPHRRTIVRN